ncbi:MAG: GNAT family N-acetyltransferase [Clostridia bacterium]|nr:GNAT family N-acetyltransferase [Clostridia bacterium]
MTFIGIDLAWPYKNETSVCVMDETGEVVYLNSDVYTDDDLIAIIKGYGSEPVCIAIDAPWLLKKESDASENDRAFMKTEIHGQRIALYASNCAYLTGTCGQIRAELLMNLIQKALPSAIVSEKAIENQSTIVGTAPSGICFGLFPETHPVKYRIKRTVAYEETKKEMERLLRRFRYIEEKEQQVFGLMSKLGGDIGMLDEKRHKLIQDRIDAFLSAYGIYAIYKGYAIAKTFGDSDQGFITIPVANRVISNSEIGELKDRVSTKKKDFMIRFAQKEDAGLIVKYILDLATYEDELDQVTVTADTLEKHMFDFGGAEALIGEYKGQPVGFAFFHQSFSTFLGKPGISLVDLYIEPEVRGNGFGKIMLSYLAQVAEERHCERLEWWCHDWNQTAIDRYVNWGAGMVNNIRVYRMDGARLNEFSKGHRVLD